MTPVMKWLAGWIFLMRSFYGGVVKWLLRLFVMVLIAGFGLLVWQGSVVGYDVPERLEEGGEGEGQEKDKEKEKEEGKT